MDEFEQILQGMKMYEQIEAEAAELSSSKTGTPLDEIPDLLLKVVWSRRDE